MYGDGSVISQREEQGFLSFSLSFLGNEYYSREQPSFLFCFQYQNSQKKAKERRHT